MTTELDGRHTYRYERTWEEDHGYSRHSEVNVKDEGF
jgi:hypothetical protein